MLIKMFIFKVVLCIITISIAKSEVDLGTVCKNNYTDETNTVTDLSKYCSNKLCIEKCCRSSELLYSNGTCGGSDKIWKFLPNLKRQYDAINILSSLNPNKTLPKDAFIIYNQRDLYKCTSEHLLSDEYEILEDGSISRQDTETKKWSRIERLTYCIDYKLYMKGKQRLVKVIIREINSDPPDKIDIEIFETVGVSISSFFLFLVLVVYCLLPELRNLSGLVLMAYTFSLLFAFITKLVITFNVKSQTAGLGFCKRITPFLYMFFLSSIFWLSVISFDVWSGLRRFRIKRDSKRKELVRFLYYALYGWGTPLLITAIVTTLDNVPISSITKPQFNDCFYAGTSYDYYFRIPIGILIIFNIVLFFVTIYNIWKTKRGVKNSSSRSKQQNTKFSTYVKLSVMMGVNWCMELIEYSENLWLYIAINIYNLSIGVALFYLFLCNKKVLALLCKKFNIRNEFTKNLDAQLSQRTKTTLVSRSIAKNKMNNKDQNQGLDVVQICPKEEIPPV